MSNVRRWLMFVLVAALALGLAACAAAPAAPAAEAPAEAAPAEEAAAEAPAAEGAPSGPLEIFSWWTTGGEVEALDAVYAIINERYPEIEIENAALVGGAGQGGAMKALLETRMRGGEPPDSFQVHLGRELIDSHVIADRMEPLDFLFEEEGLNDVFPQDLIDIASYEGHPYSVPINIHRSNMLWYSPEKLAAAGVEAVPTTWDEFFVAADKLKEVGIPAMGLGEADQTMAAHIFESILVSVFGPDDYRGLFDGSIGWDDARVTEALEILNKMFDYVNPDYLSVRQGEMVSAFATDEGVAMFISGDWSHGQLKAMGYTDYSWAPSPGTDGIFIVLSDSFGLPKNAPNRDNAISFLKVVGSREGQDAFNPIKGSIPARVDGDPSLYDEYQLTAMEDFATNTLVPSIQHGAATKQSFILDYDFAINEVAANRDVAKGQAMLVQAAEDAGFGE